MGRSSVPQLKPYCQAAVASVEAHTVFAIGDIATRIAALPSSERSEAIEDTRCLLAEQFSGLGRGPTFVGRWVDLTLTAIQLIVALRTQADHPSQPSTSAELARRLFSTTAGPWFSGNLELTRGSGFLLTGLEQKRPQHGPGAE
jgi:hypothetical protein